MINLYCEFKGNRRKIIRKFRKQLICSHVIAAKEYTFGIKNEADDIADVLNGYTEMYGYETKVLSGYIVNCDIFIPDAPDVLKNILLKEYTIAKSRYLLIHLYKTPAFWNELVAEMGKLGIVMIQLHHLRHSEYKETESPLGLLHMLDANDISGKNGRKAQKAAFNMIKDGIVTFIGGLNIQKAYNTVIENFGRDTADKLFVTNPGKVLLDESIY